MDIFDEAVAALTKGSFEKITKVRDVVWETNQKQVICPVSDLFSKLPEGLDFETTLAYVDAEICGVPKSAESQDLYVEEGIVYMKPSAM